MVKINPNNLENNLIVIPGYSNKSFLSMLKIVMKSLLFNNYCVYVLCWGLTIKQLSDDITKDITDQSEQYKINEEFRIELAKILNKILRSSNFESKNLNLLGKSAGGGIAIHISGMNEMIKKLLLCCPATTYGCKPLVNRKDLEIYLSWNQDDPMIKISESCKFMNDMNEQGNEYKFYCYLKGGDELNEKFLVDIVT